MNTTLNTQVIPGMKFKQPSGQNQLLGSGVNALLDSQSPMTFTFSVAEFWLLVHMVGAKAVYGFTNPYAGLPHNEQQAMKDDVLQTLIQREYVQQVKENEFVLQNKLADVLTACTIPRYSLLICSQTVEGASVRRMLYITPKLAVDCVENLSGNYQLTARPTLSSFQEILYRILDISEDFKGDSAMNQLESILSRAHQKCAAGQIDAGIDMLQTIGLTAFDAERLGKALSVPCTGMSITLIVHPLDAEPYPKKSFAMWQTKDEIWLLQPYVKGVKTHFVLKTIKSQGFQI